MYNPQPTISKTTQTRTLQDLVNPFNQPCNLNFCKKQGWLLLKSSFSCHVCHKSRNWYLLVHFPAAFECPDNLLGRAKTTGWTFEPISFTAVAKTEDLIIIRVEWLNLVFGYILVRTSQMGTCWEQLLACSYLCKLSQIFHG